MRQDCLELSEAKPILFCSCYFNCCFFLHEVLKHSKALCAKSNLFHVSTNFNPRCVQVGFKNLSCSVFCMRNIVSILDSFAAIHTYSCHIDSILAQNPISLKRVILWYNQVMDTLLTFVVSFAVLIYSVILHELAHGLVADRLGDPTARLSGRLTLNPLPHIDLFWTILLPLMLMFTGGPIFGGAKPVPIDPFNLKEGKKDVALVALAGPATNLLLAIIAALLIRTHIFNPAEQILTIIFSLNVYLAVFNLLPLPPLDGSKVFALLLPDREAAAFMALGNIGILILFLLLAFPIGGFYLPTFMQNIYASVVRLMGF